MRYSRSLVLSFGLGAVLAACGDDGETTPAPPADAGDAGGVPSATARPSATVTPSALGSSTTLSTSTVAPTATQAPSSTATSTSVLDGGTEPDTGLPETDGSTSTDAGFTPPDASVPGFIIESPNFDDGAALPDAYTCEGKPFGGGYSPELNWSGAPEGTESYALVFRDTSVLAGPEVNRFRAYHYVLWNVPATFSGIPEHLGVGAVLEDLGGAEQFRGGPVQEPEFFGPCPSWRTFCSGDERVTDSYEFVLYSFDTVQTPPAPQSGVNYGMALEAYFEATAVAKTVLNATSNASPSSATFLPPGVCPANAADGGVDDGGTDGSVDPLPGDAGVDGSVDPLPSDAGLNDGSVSADGSVVDGSVADGG